MREHLKRMQEAAHLAAAKRRTKPAPTPKPAKKRKKTVEVDSHQMVLPFDPALDLSDDDGSEPVSSPGVDASEAPQPGEELL